MPALEVRSPEQEFPMSRQSGTSLSRSTKESSSGSSGPNGAGKTTTIRMIIGVLKPDAGSIQIEGVDLSKNYFEAKSKIGAIPEVGNIYPDLSARGEHRSGRPFLWSPPNP